MMVTKNKRENCHWCGTLRFRAGFHRRAAGCRPLLQRTNDQKVFVSSVGLELLQQRVRLALRGFDAVRPDDTRGTMAVEQEDELLSLKFELLNLGFKVRV